MWGEMCAGVRVSVVKVPACDTGLWNVSAGKSVFSGPMALDKELPGSGVCGGVGWMAARVGSLSFGFRWFGEGFCSA